MTAAGRDTTVAPASVWHVRGRDLTLDRPIIMGVVNVTPDSFSDGGHFLSPDAAVAHGERLLAEGADILDIGGESTRPQGAVAVDLEEELRRVLPVVKRLRAARPEALLSVDTVKGRVAAAVLAAGADIINDVSALRLDADVGSAVAKAGAGLILMHSRGGATDMASYAHAGYGPDPVAEVVQELAEAVDRAEAAGIAARQLALDPGLGFAKMTVHSLAVLRELPRIAALGRPVVVGASRKRFVGELTGRTSPAERVAGTIGANVMAFARGARIFRVHDVAAARDALDIAWEIAREN